MVLPPSPADPASDQDWLGTVHRALVLSGGGVLVLIAEARRERLPGLVRALSRMRDNDIHVCMRAADLLALPLDATVLLQVRAEDASWLNINRPLFASQRLRTILWAEDEAAPMLQRHAPDFFDWISHVIFCPEALPEFAVRGLHQARDFAPGIAWRGPMLADTIERIDPGTALAHVNARVPYRELVAAARAPGWLVIDDVKSAHDLLRARWALAEAHRAGRCIVRDAGCDTPGFWPIDAHMMTWDDAVASLRACAVPAPSAARLAALLGLESSAMELLCSLMEHGIEPETLSNWPDFQDEADLGAYLARIAWQRGWLELDESALAFSPGQPAVARALAHEPAWRQARDQMATSVQSALESWNQGAPLQLSANQAAVWAGTPGIEPPPATDHYWQRAEAGYWLEATLARMTADSPPGAWATLVDWAISLQFADIAQFWSDEHGLAATDRAHIDHAQANIQARHRDRAALLETLDQVLQTRGDLQAAESTVREAVQQDQAALGPGHPDLAKLQVMLARVLFEQGKHDEALALWHELVAQVARRLGPDHPDYGTILSTYAAALAAQGRQAEAEDAAQQALACLHDSLGPEHPGYATALHDLARIQLARGKYQSAEQLLRQALALKERASGASHPDLVDTLRTLARTLQAQSKYGEAVDLHTRALTILEHTPGADRATLVMTHMDLGQILAILGLRDAAMTHFLCAGDINTANNDDSDPATTRRLRDFMAQLASAAPAPASARAGERIQKNFADDDEPAGEAASSSGTGALPASGSDNP